MLDAGLQATGLTAVVRNDHGWWVVGVLVCASRVALALACVRGVPAARADGLGVTHVGSVPVVAAVASLAVVGVAVGLAGLALGSAWSTVLGLVAMVAIVLAVLLRCVRRLGGITGDVLGAAVEVSFAVLVLAAATA